MVWKYVPLLTGLLLVSSMCAPALGAEHKDGDPVVCGTYHYLQSEAMGQEREVLVSLPYGYDESADISYPVFYVLNGDVEVRLMQAVATMEMLDAVGKAPQMIVIGLDNQGRFREYGPVDGDGNPRVETVQKFQQYLIDEVAPWVEENYRAASFRVLMGASNGGLFATYTWLTKPGAFDAYIAASPSIGWGTEFMTNLLDSAIGSARVFDERVYFNYATDDLESIVLNGTPPFLERLTDIAPEELRLTTEVIEDGGHVPYISVHNGLAAVFSDWPYPEAKLRADGIAGLREHTSRLSEAYGFPVRATSRLLMDLGTEYLRNGLSDSALVTYTLYNEQYPESVIGYYLIGETYRRMEDTAAAREWLEKALEVEPTFGPARQRLDALAGEG